MVVCAEGRAADALLISMVLPQGSFSQTASTSAHLAPVHWIQKPGAGVMVPGAGIALPVQKFQTTIYGRRERAMNVPVRSSRAEVQSCRLPARDGLAD